MSPARVSCRWRSSSACSGRQRSVRLTPLGLPAVLLIRRSCSSRPPTLRSGAAAVSEGGRRAASCRAGSVVCVRPPAGPVQGDSGVLHGARAMTGSRADRLDRALSEIEAGRANARPALDPRYRSIQDPDFEVVFMTSTVTKVQARRQGDGRHRHAEHQRRNVEIRRVAVLRPRGSHFKLLPVWA